MSLFIRVFLRCKVPTDFLKHTFILHTMLGKVQGKREDGPWRRRSLTVPLLPSPSWQGPKWAVAAVLPQAAAYRSSLGFPYHLSCEILGRLLRYPGYKTESLTFWGPRQSQVNQDRTLVTLKLGKVPREKSSKGIVCGLQSGLGILPTSPHLTLQFVKISGLIFLHVYLVFDGVCFT